MTEKTPPKPTKPRTPKQKAHDDFLRLRGKEWAQRMKEARSRAKPAAKPDEAGTKPKSEAHEAGTNADTKPAESPTKPEPKEANAETKPAEATFRKPETPKRKGWWDHWH